MPQQKELPGKLDHFLTTEIEKQTLRSIIQNAPNDLRAARSISIFIAVMRLNEEETEEALKKVVDFIAQDPALGRSRAEQIKTALMNDAIGYDYSWLVTPEVMRKRAAQAERALLPGRILDWSQKNQDPVFGFLFDLAGGAAGLSVGAAAFGLERVAQNFKDLNNGFQLSVPTFVSSDALLEIIKTLGAKYPKYQFAFVPGTVGRQLGIYSDT